MKIVLLVLVFWSSQLNAQELVFSSEVSTDNITADEVFELTFTISNGDGEFTAPELESFQIVGGPNVQSSIQIINGDMNQEKSYTYYLKPLDIGELTIEPAQLVTDEGIISTPEIQIIVNGDSSKLEKKSKRKGSDSYNNPKKSIFDKNSIRKI